MKVSNDNEAWSRGGTCRHRKIKNDRIRLKIGAVTNLSMVIKKLCHPWHAEDVGAPGCEVNENSKYPPIVLKIDVYVMDVHTYSWIVKRSTRTPRDHPTN